MKKVLVVAAVTALAATAFGCWAYEGMWSGELNLPRGVAFTRNGNVYVADSENHRIQYFTAGGSFLGKWGSRGSGNGQFNFPSGVAFAPGGNVYVADTTNSRIQYFRWSDVAVSPASLGRVKALFK